MAVEAVEVDEVVEGEVVAGVAEGKAVEVADRVVVEEGDREDKVVIVRGVDSGRRGEVTNRGRLDMIRRWLELVGVGCSFKDLLSNVSALPEDYTFVTGIQNHGGKLCMYRDMGEREKMQLRTVDIV